MSTLKILTHLYFIKQKIKIKNGFAEVVYNALVVEILIRNVFYDAMLDVSIH